MTLLFSILIAAASPMPAIDAAARGLVAVVEEDGQRDVRVESVRTRGCRTVVQGRGRSWTIEWRQAARVALEDTFVFVDAPPTRIAIVGDASRPRQAARLRALAAAMRSAAQRCAG